MRSEHGSKGTLAGLICFESKRPRRTVHPPARAPEPTGLGSGKPWPPAQMLEVFYLFQVPAAPALAVSCSSDERAAIWDGPHIVAYWDGLPTPSSRRHAEIHALRAHVVVVFASGRALVRLATRSRWVRRRRIDPDSHIVSRLDVIRRCQIDHFKRAFSGRVVTGRLRVSSSETEGHVERPEKVFDIIGAKPQGKTCDAIVGITEEGPEIMKEYKDSPALDAGLLAAAQAVEH